MKKIVKYVTLDGTTFKKKKKAKKYDHNLIRNCFIFDYSNPTDGAGTEKYDFQDYGVNSKETIKKILELIHSKKEK